jgi:phosphoenolpyruvate-protein kinase (PTS system EI component)
VSHACEKARAVKSAMKLGVCGEHGGDPASIAKCERVGLDYVSCSPFRVPVARLAAARAALEGRDERAAQQDASPSRRRQRRPRSRLPLPAEAAIIFAEPPVSERGHTRGDLPRC